MMNEASQTGSGVVPGQAASNEGHQLLLTNRKFVDLVLEFLGKKEQLLYRSRENFAVRLNDLEQFHYLIEQKISKEHGVDLTHLAIDITYNDSTERKLSGIDSLQSFHEVRDVYPIKVVLAWNIVVKYPNAESIENQKINLSFNCRLDEEIPERISLFIEHTNIVWGNEVLRMFELKIDELKKPYSQIYLLGRRFVRDFTPWRVFKAIFWPAMIIFFSIFITVSVEEGNTKRYDYNKIMQGVIDSDNDKESILVSMALRYSDEGRLSALSDKITDEELRAVIVENTFDIDEGKVLAEFFRSALLFVALVISLFLLSFALVYELIRYGRVESSIQMTDRSLYRIQRNESKGKLPHYSIVSIITTVILGVFINLVSRYF